MRRMLMFAAMLLSAVPLTAQSRLETFTLRSELLGAEKSCTIYLPDGFDADPTRRYPVLYLLHGASDTHTAWSEPTKGQMQQILDEAIAEGRSVKMVVVMPDASGEDENHTGRHMGYYNVPDWPYERFFFEELMPAVERRYRIRSEKQSRAIAGLSMGGGGTATYAQHHPELFSSACPLSAAMEPRPIPGDPNDYERSRIENSPLRFLQQMTDEQAAALRTVRWRVDCGDDDFLWQGNIRFYEQMRLHNIPLEYRMRDGGHTWRYWRTALPEVLTFVSIGFGQE